MAVEALIEFVVHIVGGSIAESAADIYAENTARRRGSAWRVLLVSFLVLLVLCTILVLLFDGSGRSMADRVYFVLGASAAGAFFMVMLYWGKRWILACQERKAARLAQQDASRQDISGQDRTED